MKIIFILLLSLLILIINNEKPLNNFDDYCNGWKDGYIQGWCYEVPNCIKPIVPLCPIPKTECNKGYNCGYNRGFIYGQKNRKR